MIYFFFFFSVTLLVFAILNFFLSKNSSNESLKEDFEAHLARNNKKNKRVILIDRINGRKLVRKVMGSRLDGVEKKLEQANYPFDMEKEDFVILNTLVPVLFGVIFAVVTMIRTEQVINAIIGGFVGLGVALIMIHLFLTAAINKRKRIASKELPDFIDLLTINLEAGLGFDLSLKRIIDQKENLLSEEFTKYLREIEIGKTRKIALENLARRVDIDSMHMLSKNIIQADELGVSIVKVLRVQSLELRDKRKDAAEEKAMKAPIKILFPLLFFIFPVLFIVLLLPIIIQFLTAIN